MGGAGRPPTPRATKVARGNPGKRALGDEPTPPEWDAEGPKPPAWADEKWPVSGPPADLRQREMWADLVAILEPMNLLTPADADAAAMYCEAYADWREAIDHIEDNGIVLLSTTDRGGETYKANPAVAIRSDAWRRMDHILQLFGMSPVARAKVPAVGGGEDDPFAEFEGPSIRDGKRAQ